MKKPNQEIRNLISRKCLAYKDVAEAMGIERTSFSRLMSKEINPKKKEKIIDAINSLSFERCRLNNNFDNTKCGNCKHNVEGFCAKNQMNSVKDDDYCEFYRWNILENASEYVFVKYIDKEGNPQIVFTTILDFVKERAYFKSISADDSCFSIMKIDDAIDDEEHHFVNIKEIIGD